MNQQRTSAPARFGATNLQRASAAVGAVFLLVGVLGFVPGITTDDWLHLVLGVGMVGVGVLLARDRGGAPSADPTRP